MPGCTARMPARLRKRRAAPLPAPFTPARFVLAPRTIPISGLVGAAALLSRVITGDGLPGTAGSVAEWAAAVLLPAAVVTEVIKISGGMQVGAAAAGDLGP